uniref:ATP synthase subunit a n=1 Tax=Mesaphorura yosii TaxID=1840514 RepID=A0A6H0EVW5_9HEXA|nr:ATP synthase F0 subunit 6 [Mesaphorura yosii]
MMSSLFSSFDPSSSIIFTSNWFSLMIISSFIPMMFWLLPNFNYLIFKKIKFLLFHEIKILTNLDLFKGAPMMFFSLFIFILLNNFMGLFPFIFTATSHMITTFTLALPLWLSFMLIGWINFTNSMFSHLVPQGTPSALMSFMVIIETISNMIRPGTLAVRLSANMIAGHLLLTLLGNLTASSNQFILFSLIIAQITLLILESAVAMIQAYVFMVLTSLYLSESSPH